MEFKAGEQVEIMVHGEWEGPYTVTSHKGRTPEHIVLRSTVGETLFEHFNDAPFNTRAIQKEEI